MTRFLPLGNSLLEKARFLGNACLNVVYPPLCTLCGGDFDRDNDVELCPACVEAICNPSEHWCRKCGMPMEKARTQESQCNRCTKQRVHYRQVIVLARYENAMREAVIACKQAYHEPLAMALGRLLGKQVFAQLDPLPDLVTFVPSHLRRKLSRGTTPAETLARQVGRVLDRPVRSLLQCVRATAKQATLPAASRSANVRGAFVIAKRFQGSGKSILIVDDVMTTGATLGETARVLHAAGVSQVFVAAAARGLGKT